MSLISRLPPPPPVFELLPHLAKVHDGFARAAGELQNLDILNRLNASITELVTATTAFRGSIDAAFERHHTATDAASKLFEDIFLRVQDKVTAEFYPSDSAPDHEQRVALTSCVLYNVEEELNKLGTMLHIQEDVVVHLQVIRPLIEGAIVIAGDLIERHPVLVDMLLCILGIVFAESLFGGVILLALGFGSLVLSKAPWRRSYKVLP
ncbi:hypothetical protein HYDPIDRAFT_31721 [Hydnomerulius pinastri MD-312]|uniref:Uncharacterized protein n=1 Tax=Hydnomerulius pinastri MD-312 TaxID=994086 RepID=A0A0C9WBQ7_9AGAM|nr:hypothetical protein HYDPIDRAFT_31721 [Hydnomerulius pinastri MD-312]